ncbi:MAG: YbhB/YbcL family Raf kinase inhibitor-like protein [Ignavibacteria bacterium]|nr:YbhB/YbcL family Raf kinase inhibitor-like protein [Ignavibacteria bacterium]MCU7514501.1 YbhB/YbcL family Raf kinase inhibitor-like protein [Ignavibacteria bacterium]
MAIKFNSPAFKHGEPIPAKYTCDGQNVSPALQWEELPDGTKTVAIILEDPDAPGGTFIHWIIYDIPVNITSLQEGVTSSMNLPDGAAMGTNDARRIGYYGPCPPSGVHHYHFRLYALKNYLRLDAGATRKELDLEMKDHILGQAEVMGTYKRER